MVKISVKAAISLTLAANIAVLSASSPAIGIALSSGVVTINHSRTEGNASIFDGATVETGAFGSRLQLKNGSNVQLSSESRGRIYQNRLVLEKGNTKIQTLKAFEVDTNVVKISGSGNVTAQVSLHGGTVQVASLVGTLQVANPTGAFITSIAPGMSFDFSAADAGSPQNPSTPPGTTPATNNSTKSGGGFAGGANPALVIAGIIITGAVIGTSMYFGTQGSTSPQACFSPCSTH